MESVVYDIIIIGGGPAGLSAGIYAGRGGLKSLLFECFDPPSQAVMVDVIENYPGFPEGIEGFRLIERLKHQAENFGLEFRKARVDRVAPDDKEESIWQIKTGEGVYRSLTVVLAVGARHRRLGVEGEEEFRGKGVSYCAVCDGAFFKDKDIVVAGGGNSAVSEALYLTRFAKKVVLVHRRDRLRAVSALAQKAKDNKKIEIILNSVITRIQGKDKVGGVELRNLSGENKSLLACQGIFISVGYAPNTEPVAGLVEVDGSGYVIADETMQTSKPGIFACGDCRAKPLRQAITACGDGAVAATSAIKYVDRIKGRAYE